MRKNGRIALVTVLMLGLTGWCLSMITMGSVEEGKVAYVEYGCFDCHGSFESNGTVLDRDPDNPNAFGGMAPAIIGWNADDLRGAVYDGIYQEINYYKSRPPEAEVFGEDELSDADLADITAFLNPNFKDGDAANGEELYRETCFACHGSDALGRGLVGPPIVFKSFEVVKAVARTGILPPRMQGLMPLYNDTLDEATLNSIAEYLMSLNTRN